ncbi:MAG: 3-oxoacyl-[acyl-carrier-protein] reductase [Candidatus Kapaibacterium sp.]
MEKRFSGQTVIITGGCRGIGKAMVERFLAEGARVFALDYVIPEEGETFIDDKALAENVSCIQADVTSADSIRNAIAEVAKASDRIDVLINNAGITRDNLMLRMKEEDWDAVINTNLKGAFLCTKAIMRIMMAQRSGRIINVGSIVGSIGNAGQANYSASKAGMFGFTKSLAKELGSRNILVNCIAPGYVHTPMTDRLTDEQRAAFVKSIPLGRVCEPEEIASVAAFLASDDSKYITGQVIHVDGGLAM